MSGARGARSTDACWHARGGPWNAGWTGRSVLAVRWLAGLVAAGAVLNGCGSSCEELHGLTAERDAMRAAYLQLVRSSASPEETERADDRLHAVEAQVFDLEQTCR